MSKQLFIIILCVKALFSLIWIQTSEVGLVPDEAQYWTWSQELGIGYYSKPPGIAWQIALGTALFGNTEVGVRFVAVLFAALQAWLTYRLASACGINEKRALYAGVVMALIPLGIMGSLMATTDGGLVLFWTLGCLILLSTASPNPYLLGGVIACGALFKWPIYLLWFFAWPKLSRKQLFVGIAVSLLGLLPSLLWNASHGWVTFKHVWGNIAGSNRHEVGTAPLSEGNALSFVGAQMMLLSPIFFALLLAAGISVARQWRTTIPSIKTCFVITFSLLGLYLTLSLFKKMQGNWCVFLYPTGVVFITYWATEKWVKWGLATSLVIVVCLLTFPLPYSMSPFRHQVGWNQIAPILTQNGYDPKKHFLFGDKYQMTSLLSFYAPEQKRAYFLNLHGARKNQFSFWPSLADEQLGKTGYYFLAENISQLDPKPYQEKLAPYFKKVTLIGTFPLYFNPSGKPVKLALLFLCENYNGRLPPDPNKF